jgi:hypothetical protein
MVYSRRYILQHQRSNEVNAHDMHLSPTCEYKSHNSFALPSSLSYNLYNAPTLTHERLGLTKIWPLEMHQDTTGLHEMDRLACLRACFCISKTSITFVLSRSFQSITFQVLVTTRRTSFTPQCTPHDIQNESFVNVVVTIPGFHAHHRHC